jgi:hypothetical protein
MQRLRTTLPGSFPTNGRTPGILPELLLKAQKAAQLKPATIGAGHNAGTSSFSLFFFFLKAS